MCVYVHFIWAISFCAYIRGAQYFNTYIVHNVPICKYSYCCGFFKRYIYMYMCVNIKSWTCCIAYFIRHHLRAGSYISSHVFRQLWSWSVGTHFFSMCVCVRERVTVLWKLFFLLCVWERESDSIVEIVGFFYPCLFSCFFSEVSSFRFQSSESFHRVVTN